MAEYCYRSNCCKRNQVYKNFSGREKKIQFQIEEKNQKVLLHIKDNGIGIPEQDVKRIFDPFLRE